MFSDTLNVNSSTGLITFFLVGDAAAGVPFFKSLNMGFSCGTILANCLAGEISSYQYHLRSMLVIYKEIMLAKIKNSGLFFANSIKIVNSISPFQVIYLPKILRNKLTNTNAIYDV